MTSVRSHSMSGKERMGIGSNEVCDYNKSINQLKLLIFGREPWNWRLRYIFITKDSIELTIREKLSPKNKYR